MNKTDFLLSELNEKIAFFEKNSNEHKKLYRRFRYIAFIITGLLSILSGLALHFPYQSQQINMVMLVLSATAGIFTSFEGLRKADDLWIHERTTYYSLADLKRELEFAMQGENFNESTADKFFTEFQKILAQSGDTWRQKVLKNNTKKEKSPGGNGPPHSTSK
jgi:hypothetical protein